MKNSFMIATMALALAGCSSYSEIARWDSSVMTNDGEVPVASFITQNFSYQLLGLWTIGSGVPWTSGNEDIMDDYNVSWFSGDKATLDGNLISLRYALDRVGSHRIAQLYATEDDDWWWSLCLIRRHEVRTKCLILKE